MGVVWTAGGNQYTKYWLGVWKRSKYERKAERLFGRALAFLLALPQFGLGAIVATRMICKIMQIARGYAQWARSVVYWGRAREHPSLRRHLQSARRRAVDGPSPKGAGRRVWRFRRPRRRAALA